MVLFPRRQNHSGSSTRSQRQVLLGPRKDGQGIHGAVGCKPSPPCGRTTMISSIRLDGSTACMRLSGSADTAVFLTYIGQTLCPKLKPGDILVKDNLAVHKSPQVSAVVQVAGSEARFLLDIDHKSQAISASLRFTRSQFHRTGDNQPQTAEGRVQRGKRVEQDQGPAAQCRGLHAHGSR